MESSNNSNTIWYTQILPTIRRTSVHLVAHPVGEGTYDSSQLVREADAALYRANKQDEIV